MRMQFQYSPNGKTDWIAFIEPKLEICIQIEVVFFPFRQNPEIFK